jgi:hypothetical protein
MDCLGQRIGSGRPYNTVTNTQTPKVSYPGANWSLLIRSSILTIISLVTNNSASWNTSLPA